MRRGFLVLLLLVLQTLPAAAADLASLVADRLTIRSGSVLVAEGHVEVFYQGRHFWAQRLAYDSRTDRLTIDGPIWIDDGQGTVFQAQSADLSADMTEGVLLSARLVLQERLQMAAGEVLRTGGGRYTALRGVAASSCSVCRTNPTPLWEIRAQSVIHDTQEHQIWFSGAQLRFVGIPLIYIPELRVPDPSLKRATGFLLPSLRSSTRTGTSLRFPYFITLGQSRDLLLTPVLASGGDQTLNLRYRQAFRTGDITLSGAVSQDGLLGPDSRGYLQADGGFGLPEGYHLDFHLIRVSDPAYLLDYGISEDDRLVSSVEITRTRRNAWISGALTGVQSLRTGERDGSFPSAMTDFTLERRFEPAILGGTAGLQIQTHTTLRESANSANPTGDGISKGLDLGRVSARADWRRNWLLQPGIELSSMASLAADDYQIAQDDYFQGNSLRVTGTAAVELRWPWTRTGPRLVQTIEPVVQLALSPTTVARVPNEDSTLVEFDEGNLMSLDRFPGADAVETGARANLGLNYDALFADGTDLAVTLGRVLRFAGAPGFPAASGLAHGTSDWLVAWNLSRRDSHELQLTNRLILDDALQLTKGELRFDLSRPRYDLSGGYAYVQRDPAEDRDKPISELVLDGSYRMTGAWTLAGNSRYNLDAAQFTRAGLDLTFRNECLSVDLSLSRRFTSSSSVKPSTEFGLSVELLGFGGTGLPGMARRCSQ